MISSESRFQECPGSDRHGNIILLSAGVLVMVMAFAALSVDVGYLSLVKGQLQNAVDAATLAGAMELNPHGDQTDVAASVRQSVVEIASLNQVGNQAGLYVNPDVDVELGRRDWNAQNQTFQYAFGPQAVPYNILRVSGRLTNTASGDRRLPLFFAPALGQDRVPVQVTSTATFQPRDMMLVLDFSGSMNDDTEFKSVPSLGQSAVTTAITTMWNELGNPVYGTMPFIPTHVTVAGVPLNGTIPHVDVTWQGRAVGVASTSAITSVRLKFANGNTQTFSGTGTIGTFQGTSSNANSLVRKVWVLSGGNAAESPEVLGEDFAFANSDLVTYLGLGAVTYPNPSGSWLDFVDYCNTSSYVSDAGFRYRFGTMSLINYWNEKYAMASQSNDLWKCSTYPLKAVKRASDVLIDYVSEVESDDRIGLTIYSYQTSGGNGALNEIGLTSDFPAIKPLYNQRQAGHYEGGTNIYAGIRQARLHLESQARPQAFRMMVLMTDGVANLPYSGTASSMALSEAQLCASAKIRIMTVSLGLEADTALMQQIADTTGGVHFNVPGGTTTSEMEDDLMDVFHRIAADRPLKLIPSGSGQ